MLVVLAVFMFINLTIQILWINLVTDQGVRSVNLTDASGFEILDSALAEELYVYYDMPPEAFGIQLVYTDKLEPERVDRKKTETLSGAHTASVSDASWVVSCREPEPSTLTSQRSVRPLLASRSVLRSV
mgnify:CR=1 FL=1